MDRGGVLIVGASLAGLRAAESVREAGFTGDLTILGDESVMPYDRPPLSKEVLLGKKSSEDVSLPLRDGLEAFWELGDRATELDVREKVVRTEAGKALQYESLIIATGSAPRRLPGIETDRESVLTVRTLRDSLTLRGALARTDRLLVVGGGFIGVEVASAARELGVEVTVLTLDPPLAVAGNLISNTAEQLLRGHGVDLVTEHTIGSLKRDGGNLVAKLDDGSAIEASLAVIAVGAVPNVGWLAGSGLSLEDGILCDASLKAIGVEDVYAAGDVARWPNPLFSGRSMRIEHWANAIEHGNAVGASVVKGVEAEPLSSLPNVWSDHFGTRFQAVGLPGRADRFEVVAGDPERSEFAAAAFLDNHPIGAVGYGMGQEFVKLRAKIRSQLLESGSGR